MGLQRQIGVGCAADSDREPGPLPGGDDDLGRLGEERLAQVVVVLGPGVVEGEAEYLAGPEYLNVFDLVGLVGHGDPDPVEIPRVVLWPGQGIREHALRKVKLVTGHAYGAGDARVKRRIAATGPGDRLDAQVFSLAQ